MKGGFLLTDLYVYLRFVSDLPEKESFGLSKEEMTETQ